MTARLLSPPVASATISITALVLAEIMAMSLWFVSTALLPEMRAEVVLSAGQVAALATAVQAGFVAAALTLAALGLADRFDPRLVFAGAALIAAAANAAMVLLAADHPGQIGLRAMTGAALAGVYPVGMKIAVGWTTARRGALVGLLVGALTLGSAAPHLIAFGAGQGWHGATLIASGLAVVAAALMLLVRLGPHHRRAPGLSLEALALSLSEGAARLTAFAAIALGGLACLPAGSIADRIGKAEVARGAMLISALAGVATAASLGGPPVLTVLAALVWGVSVIPDSAQFSALVADAAPAERAGSLMTFQTAAGFLLSAISVQILPLIAAESGWRLALLLLVPGPVLGAVAMSRLIALQRNQIAR